MNKSSVCICKTIKFDEEATQVYFDAIFDNATRKCAAEIGNKSKNNGFLPDLQYWQDLKEYGEYCTLNAKYIWADKEPVYLWVE